MPNCLQAVRKPTLGSRINALTLARIPATRNHALPQSICLLLLVNSRSVSMQWRTALASHRNIMPLYIGTTLLQMPQHAPLVFFRVKQLSEVVLTKPGTKIPCVDTFEDIKIFDFG